MASESTDSPGRRSGEIHETNMKAMLNTAATMTIRSRKAADRDRSVDRAVSHIAASVSADRFSVTPPEPRGTGTRCPSQKRTNSVMYVLARVASIGGTSWAIATWVRRLRPVTTHPARKYFQAGRSRSLQLSRSQAKQMTRITMNQRPRDGCTAGAIPARNSAARLLPAPNSPAMRAHRESPMPSVSVAPMR